MARYRIAALNYMTSGSKRSLVNLDTQMVYGNVRNIYILSREENRLSNIGTEQFEYRYLPTDYIEKEHPINNRQGEYNRTQRPQNGNPHSLSTEPLSEEEALTSIILNEEQRIGYETDLSSDMRILLQQDSDRAEIREQLEKFKRYETNRTFVIEDRLDSTPDRNAAASRFGLLQTTVYPLYDIRDVSIKSKITKQQQNSSLRSSAQYLGKFVDIYCPQLSAYPIGFCQVRNDAYVMTERIGCVPYMLRTSFVQDRKTGEVDDHYDISLESGGTKTYLYRSAEDYGEGSIYGFLSSQALSAQSQLFVPAKSLDGMGYNYVVAVDQQDNASVYENGDIYAQQIDMAKNAYTPLYSTAVSADENGNMKSPGGRDYCGVCTDGQNVYLKYYDNANYTQLSSSAADGVRRCSMQESQLSGYPYQKVETYVPNNFETRCKHKSNLFSVKISNKCIRDLVDDIDDLDDKSKAECKELYDQIHKEIRNAVKAIADNVCPANTQLFDVYFEN